MILHLVISRRIFFITCLAVICSAGVARPFSYVYIQGDKTIPFYVKREGQMLPRYGKDYCIISELNAGPIHIEVLFQQHTYPPQKFTIQVPEGGYRGFLLTKQGDAFVLYDLLEKKYLPPFGEQ
jgi:hypothetical protein